MTHSMRQIIDAVSEGLGTMLVEGTSDNPLRQLNVADIDVDAAAHHFGLPIADQFSGSVRRALSASKRDLLALFGKQSDISIYRVLDIPLHELNTSEVGVCWAWSTEGALKGSGLSSRGNRTGILLAGRVDAAEVNWELTVAVNAFHEDEAEIVLIEGATVTLDAVYAAKGAEVGGEVSTSLKGTRVTA